MITPQRPLRLEGRRPLSGPSASWARLMPRRMKLTLTALALLGTCACPAATPPWVARTSEHFKCRFGDGSYVEHQHLVKWFPYAEAVPHAQTTADWKTVTHYVVPGQKRLEIDLPVQFGCESVGKLDGHLFYRNGFQDRQRAFVLVGVDGESPPFKRLAQVSRPPNPGCTKAKPDPLLVAKGLQDAMFCSEGWMMREAPDGSIVAEAPVWSNGKHEDYPRYGLVHFVFRRRYSLATREWTPVELSDTGEIYEMGKTRGGQSWAARYECLVDRPRGGCQEGQRQGAGR